VVTQFGTDTALRQFVTDDMTKVASVSYVRLRSLWETP
jgi:hypothetical protein